MELNEVAADLAKHEAVCAERWKTAFNKFSDVEKQINRIESRLRCHSNLSYRKNG